MHVPFCSIVILNYNGEKILEQTISSVLNLHYPKDRYEIIIVDNASTDKSKDIIENYVDFGFRRNDRKKTISTKCPESQSHVIPAKAGLPCKGIQTKRTSIFLPKNIGFARGNNVGIQKAKGKYIALLNNDCMVDQNWLKEMVTVAEKDDKIFAVNPKIYLGKTHTIQNAGITIFPNGYARDRGALVKNNKQYYENDRGQYEDVAVIDAACGAAVLYRHSILDKVGFLDESFFLYYEDVEISQRAKQYGYKILYSPKAVAYHLHAATSQEWSPFFVYHSEKGRLLHVILRFPAKIFFLEFAKFFTKSILRLGYGIKNPKKFIHQWQYGKVALFFFFLWPYYLGKKWGQTNNIKAKINQ